MIARDRDGHRVEVRIAQHRTRRGERPGGLSGDPNSGGVQPRIPLPEFTDRGDMIVQGASVAKIPIGVVVKCLAAPRASTTVDGHHREPERGESLRFTIVRRVEHRSGAVELRPRIDVFDDRVRVVRVQIVRSPEQTVDRGSAVRCGRPEPLRWLPAQNLQVIGIGRLQLHYHLTIPVQYHRVWRQARA
ncbi:Uncharacterised protein [Mycobacteroides abscessus subsp. abscessus]|nr:Uncharacterised protein [Mycobacteroides abscessus subsp. abscessus]